MYRKCMIIVICSMCLCTVRSSYAQVGTIGISVFGAMMDKEELYQGGGFITHTRNGVTFASQFMIGRIGGGGVTRIDGNGSISFNVYEEEGSRIGFFVGLKVQNFKFGDIDFQGYGPSVGLTYSQSYSSISCAYVRTFGDFEQNFFIPSASLNFPLGEASWGITIGYRGEFVRHSRVNGGFLNLYHIIQ